MSIDKYSKIEYNGFVISKNKGDFMKKTVIMLFVMLIVLVSCKAGEKVTSNDAVCMVPSYLDEMPMSKSSLTEILEAEGFSEEDIFVIISKCSIDWKAVALKKAEYYTQRMSFSRDLLIEHLILDGFTYEEALYAALTLGY